MPPALEARGITKQFPGVLANDNVDFVVERGEVHALLGENGAGKTTLMNVLYGLYRPDSGEILINGQPVSFHDPRDAIRHGIGMVHQHFMLIPVFTVTENIILGVEEVQPRTKWLGPLARLDEERPEDRIERISREYGLDVDPRARVGDLPVGAQQRVEILKALYRKADILILDEPTAVLTPQESEHLFTVIRALAAQGVSVVFISHKLKEVRKVADRVSVMQRGKMVGTIDPHNASEAQLAEMMVGRKVILEVNKAPAKPGEDVLRIEGLQVLDDRKHRVVDGVTLSVRTGEIVGLAGVQGNGQTELVEALAGLRPVAGGHMTLCDHDITHASPRRITELGVGHIPEDRQKHGLVMAYSLADNLVLSTYYLPPFAHGLVRDEKAVRENAEQRIKEFDIRTPSAQVTAETLSGGNKQKVIAARELSRPIKLLIASQPTRGLDVGSIEFIHRRLVSARDEGIAVLLVSAELDEIMALSDRIAVIYKGQIIDILPRAAATREKLGLLMAGIKQEDAHDSAHTA